MFFPIRSKKIFRFCIAAIFTILVCSSSAQVGIGINPPDSSAMLHVQDTARGILIPRMTAAQRTAIHNPAEGLMVYQINETKGYWYFTGTEWMSLSNNGGKHMIVLAGDITDIQAQAKIAAEAGPNTLDIRITGCTNLTTVDLSMIKNAVNVLIVDNPVLQHIDLRNLVSVLGDQGLQVSKSPMINYLNLSSLQIAKAISGVNGLNIGSTKLINIALPSLVKAGYINIALNKVAVTLSMPLLQSFTYLYVAGMDSLANLSLPALTTAGQMAIVNDTSLTSLSFPNLATLTSSGYDFSGNRLSTPVVNDILHVFASIVPTVSGKTINLQQYYRYPAPPSGQGIIDLNFLGSHSNTVATD